MWTVVVVNLASVLERASEQVLPSVYAYVSRSFATPPARLGLITLGRTLAQSLASPFSGVAGILEGQLPSPCVLGVSSWEFCCLQHA